MAVEGGGQGNPAWNQYGRALIKAMSEVTAEAPEELHTLLLEAADYWLSVGLAIGTQHREAALRLLDLIETEGVGQAELAEDAAGFCSEAIG
ncbi:MAG: hypothetical protein ACRENX_13160 [Candidatus Dormibacteria bacterium]